MFYALMGYLQATAGYVHAAIESRVRMIRTLATGERGQGTVEYVGLILLVSLLMVGMVAAMKGFNGKQGTQLADVIVNKIKQAVDQVSFK
jgi:Flp pilus assembly pilin Flp